MEPRGQDFAHSGDLAANTASRRDDMKCLVADGVLIPEVAGEDTQSVAALFYFAPVGIQNAKFEFARNGTAFANQDAIGADAETAITDLPHGLRCESLAPLNSLDNQIVISQGMIFRERH
jgi:hypothetical protein